MKFRKMISMLLAFCLLLSLLPALGLSAAAADTQTLFYCGFEAAEDMSAWQFRDADGDGFNWRTIIDDGADGSDFGHTDGTASLFSFSYDNDTSQVLTPDNWAYTPEIALPTLGEIYLYYDVFAQDPEWWAEHYSVYASVPGEGETLLLEETLKEGEDRNTPAHRSIDLSAYAGRTIRIAFRHHNVSDVFAIGIDSVKVERVLPRDIGKVSIYVDEPVLDMPVSNAFDLGEGCVGFTVANVQWEPNDSQFQANQAYSVAVTLEVEDGYRFTQYVEPYINDKPATVISRTEEEMKIALTFPELEPGLPSMFFDDVKTTDWFYQDVEFVYYSRFMGGVDTNRFAPYGKCTRAMVVTVLYRMEGSPAHGGVNPFTDLKADWYKDAVIWAAENSIVRGVESDRFAPDAYITREQLATIMCRYAAFTGAYNPDDCIMLAGFADQSKVSAWALDAMSWAVGVGLIGGSNESDGLYLLPQGNALRCQVAAILHRYCESFVRG